MWNKIIQVSEWFGDLGARYSVSRDFNKAAKHAFITGVASTLLKVSTSRGGKAYKHEFSKFFGGGFRIKALSGQALSQSELKEIALVVLDNESLTRKLISLGWDTLEIHDNIGVIGIKYQLTKYANMRGFID